MKTISNNILTAEIDELGAQLSKLYTKNFHYLFEGPAEIWPKHSPILFPFVGRLPDGKYHYKGREYSNVPIHGFAPYSQFECVEKTQSECTMSMIVTDEIKKSYPFDFEFLVTYTLEKEMLEVRYTVKNLGSESMYYAMGSHPGFNVPMKEGLSFEDYYVQFTNAKDIKRRCIDEKYFITNNVIPYKELNENRIVLKHSLFDNDAVILEGTGNQVVIATDKDSRKVIVDYPDTKWCALWHCVKKEVPFVCIEPWFSLPGFPDSPNEITKRNDYFCLEKGQQNQHRLLITIGE